MKWKKIKYSGNKDFEECSRCDHQFKRGETAFLKCFGHGPGKITEIACKSCQIKCGLKIK